MSDTIPTAPKARVYIRHARGTLAVEVPAGGETTIDLAKAGMDRRHGLRWSLFGLGLAAVVSVAFTWALTSTVGTGSDFATLAARDVRFDPAPVTPLPAPPAPPIATTPSPAGMDPFGLKK